MKPSDTNLAKFYDVHRLTIANWRKDKPMLYKAALNFFLTKHNLN